MKKTRLMQEEKENAEQFLAKLKAKTRRTEDDYAKKLLSFVIISIMIQ